VAALAQALRRFISDRAERQRLAMNARAAAAQLPTWQDSAPLFAGRNRDGRMSGFSADWPALRESLDQRERNSESVWLPARNNALQVAFMLRSLGLGQPLSNEEGECVEDERSLEGKFAR
jgi:hypothetical protein